MHRIEFDIFHVGDRSLISFSGPFEALCRRRGRLDILREIASNPEKIGGEFARESDLIINAVESLLDEGRSFEAAWILSDLAYKDNLFFSPAYYEKYLFPVHKKLIGFLNSRKMPVIFHSDGKIDTLLPYLIEAGVEALSPLDEYADMDISCLRRRYKKELIFLEARSVR